MSSALFTVSAPNPESNVPNLLITPYSFFEILYAKTSL